MQAPAIRKSLPPPVEGWDTENSLEDMPPKRAVILENWFPSTDKVTLRPGYSSYATGLTGNVDSLLTYTALTGAGKLFAGNATSLFDVSNSGAVGAAVVTGLSNVQFQYTQIGTAGGNFLIAMNGADTPRVYDGSAWSTSTITGPVTSDLIWCNLHQRRLWMGEKESLSAWYLDPNSITGAASEFPFAAVAKLGGYIMAMGTWTRDSGDGADDVAVFLTSRGEAIVYQGTDPSSATTWSLVGVFRIGAPIGRRCLIKAGADLIFVTQDGFVAASTILQADRSQTARVAISKQVNKAVNDAVRVGADLYGWEPFLYPKGTMLIFNIPHSATASNQYVFNTITEAPCKFTGLNARCWALLGDVAFFGGPNGKVYKFDDGFSDAGTNIVGDMLPAFSYFGQPGQSKSYKRVEPVFQSNGDPFAALDLNIGFQVKRPTANPAATATSSAKWGVAKWGRGTWGTNDQVYRGWRGTKGLDAAAALRIRVDTMTVRPSLVAINIMYVPAGIT